MSRNVRYARPRLTTSDDRRYREYVAHYMVQRTNTKARHAPSQRTLFGYEAENVLRDWLRTRLRLSDQRILEYEEQRGRRLYIKYRELDALVVERQHTAWVFEIKASRRMSSVKRACRQLRETREILHLLFPQVYATILLVDTGLPHSYEQVLHSDEAVPPPPTDDEDTLTGMLDTHPYVHRVPSLEDCNSDQELIDLLVFSPQQIIRLAGHTNLSLDWAADDYEDPHTETLSEPTLYYSTEPGNLPDGNSTAPDAPPNSTSNGALAEALRRAGLS